MLNRKRNHVNKGFTLVELIITIAIIAVIPDSELIAVVKILGGGVMVFKPDMSVCGDTVFDFNSMEIVVIRFRIVRITGSTVPKITHLE